MSATRKGRNRTQAQATESQAQVAVVEPQPKGSKRGTSTAANPVATVWVIAHNMCAKARSSGAAAPSRKALVAAVQEAGVAFYTARTQVQAYLKASKGGTEVPAKLPRNVVLS